MVSRAPARGADPGGARLGLEPLVLQPMPQLLVELLSRRLRGLEPSQELARPRFRLAPHELLPRRRALRLVAHRLERGGAAAAVAVRGDSRSVLHASGFTVSSETETVYTSWFWYSLRWPPHPFITDERGLAATAASSVEKRPSWPTALSASKRWSRRC